MAGIGINLGLQNWGQSGISDPLAALSMYDDLYIFEPKNVTGADMVIADSVGSGASLSQSISARRPTIRDSNTFDLGESNADSRGFTTVSSITFRELFVVANYDLETFSGFATIIAGSGGNGAKRVMGNTTTVDMITSASVNNSGLIRINDGAETNQDVLPMVDLAVIHTASGTFASPTPITDQIWVGYNPADLNRAWRGVLGTVIFSKVALTDVQRTEVVDALKQVHSII